MRQKDIRVLKLRDITLAKIDYKGNFQGIGNAYKKLMDWYRKNEIVNSEINKTITIYHDDPNVVGIDNVRQSACIIIDKEIEPTDDVFIMEFKPGKCAVGRYEISYFEFKNAWIEMTKWIKANNLKKTGDAFEVYQDNSKTHSKKKIVIDICVPIE